MRVLTPRDAVVAAGAIVLVVAVIVAMRPGKPVPSSAQGGEEGATAPTPEPGARQGPPAAGPGSAPTTSSGFATVSASRWRETQTRLGLRRHHDEAFVRREEGNDPDVGAEDAVPAYIFDKLEAITHGPAYCARRARRRLTQVRLDALQVGDRLPVPEAEVAFDVISETEPYTWPPGDWWAEMLTALEELGVTSTDADRIMQEVKCLPDASGPRRYEEVQWPECRPDDSMCPRPPR